MFALLTTALSYADWRWPRVRPIVHGVPMGVAGNGELCLDVMRAERVSLDDMMAAAREQGIERFAEVRLAVLEADGRISFFTGDPARSGAGEEGAPAGG